MSVCWDLNMLFEIGTGKDVREDDGLRVEWIVNMNVEIAS